MGNPASVNAPAVESLPPKLRQAVVDRLIAGQPSRAVSAYLSQEGYKVSHAAIARYASRKIRPALEVGAKIAKAQVSQSVDVTPMEQAGVTRDVTREVLAAEPILARTRWMWSEVEQGVADTKGETSDVKARASMLTVGARLVELEARAMMHPGFVPSAAPTVNVNAQNVVILPSGRDDGPRALPQPAIEAEIVDAE